MADSPKISDPKTTLTNLPTNSVQLLMQLNTVQFRYEQLQVSFKRCHGLLWERNFEGALREWMRARRIARSFLDDVADAAPGPFTPAEIGPPPDAPNT